MKATAAKFATSLRKSLRLAFAPAWVFAISATALFIPAAHAEMEPYPVVKLRALDKISARTMTFEAAVGNTVKYGPLYIKVQACRKAPPIEQPESASFLQIWEVTPKGKSEWVFSGWMFASSPALSSMDHPVYDVWVLDCLTHKTGEHPGEETSEEVNNETDDAAAAGDDNAAHETENEQVDDENHGDTSQSPATDHHDETTANDTPASDAHAE